MNFPSSKNWKTVQLNQLAVIKHGYAFKGEYFSEKKTNRVLLTPGNFNVGGGWKEGKKFYSEFGELPKAYLLKAGDLIVSMTDLSKEGDTLGYSALVPDDPTRLFLHNQRVGLVLPKDELIDKGFLYYLMRSHSYQKYIVNSATGSTVKHTSPTKILDYEVRIPESLVEQKNIADLLNSFDNKIELLQKQNQTLETMAQALFKEWFVDFNFPGTTGEMIDSELGMIPAGWRVGVVIDIIDRLKISYRCDKKDLNPKGKTPIIDQGINGLYGYTERDPDFEASSKNPVIVFTNHTCNMWFINYPFCAIQNVIPFRGKDGYDDFFIYYMTKNQISFIEYKGHWPDFEYKKYIIPSVDIAKKFSTAIRTNIYKIWNNNEEIQTLSKIRDELLNKIFSD